MKTLEMLNVIKPGQKMERIKSKHSYIYGYVGFIDDVLCWDNSRNNPFQIAYDHLEDDEWQLIKEPVTWQEAIQAWIDGKTICIEAESFDHQSIFIRTIEGKTKKIEALWKDSLINDKWYIKD